MQENEIIRTFVPVSAPALAGVMRGRAAGHTSCGPSFYTFPGCWYFKADDFIGLCGFSSCNGSQRLRPVSFSIPSRKKFFSNCLWFQNKVVYLQKVTNKRMTNMISKPSLTATIKAIGPGKNAEIPVGMFTHASVRNRACNLGLEMGRTYHVHLNRERGIYIVEREK